MPKAKEVIKKDIKDPLLYLERVMLGQDPSNKSELIERANELQYWNDGDIDRGDWDDFYNFICNNFEYESTTINNSIHAAKTLAEYVYPKRKSIEISDTNVSAEFTPLTIDEISLFKEKFNDEF